MEAYRQVWRLLYGWDSAPGTQGDPELVAEALVDTVGLTQTIETLADVCMAKASHLDEFWPDADNRVQVRAYEQTAGLLLKLAARVGASAVGGR